MDKANTYKELKLYKEALLSLFLMIEFFFFLFYQKAHPEFFLFNNINNILFYTSTIPAVLYMKWYFKRRQELPKDKTVIGRTSREEKLLLLIILIFLWWATFINAENIANTYTRYIGTSHNGFMTVDKEDVEKDKKDKRSLSKDCIDHGGYEFNKIKYKESNFHGRICLSSDIYNKMKSEALFFVSGKESVFGRTIDYIMPIPRGIKQKKSEEKKYKAFWEHQTGELIPNKKNN